MAPPSRDDGCTLEERQLHHNLCLLGIGGAGGKAERLGLDLGRFSFRKPSSKLLEAVLYQIYAAVVGESAAHKVRCLSRAFNQLDLNPTCGIRPPILVQACAKPLNWDECLHYTVGRWRFCRHAACMFTCMCACAWCSSRACMPGARPRTAITQPASPPN